MKLWWVAAAAATVVLTAIPVRAQDGLDPAPAGLEAKHKRQDDGYNLIPHLPPDCNDVRIFSARGSNEPYPGRGGAMLRLLCSLFQAQGLSCDYEDVVYPANISFSGLFCQSANIGATAAQAQMTEYVQRCPDSKVVLNGYSQGASVVGDILGGGGGPIYGCEQPYNPSLPRDTAPGSNVVAVITFGEPRFTANQPYNIGLGSSYDGVAPRQGQQLADLNAYEDVIAMWCNFGDPVCAAASAPVNITAHWSYYDQYATVASRWAVATALGQTDVQLDLAQDGHYESVVLTGTNATRVTNSTSPTASNTATNGSEPHPSGQGTGSNTSRKGSSNQTAAEDAALRLSPLGGGVGVFVLVALVAAGLVSLT